jgi:hypothetical protein
MGGKFRVKAERGRSVGSAVSFAPERPPNQSTAGFSWLREAFQSVENSFCLADWL